MELKSVFFHGLKTFKDIPRIRIAQHTAANFRIRCMNRDVQRRSFTAQNPRELHIVHIRQRYIIAHHQAEAPVIIPDIKRSAHAFRHLINETENTMVAAAARLHDNCFVKDNTERFPAGFCHSNRTDISVGIRYFHFKMRICNQILEVNLIDHLLTINGNNAFTGTYSGLFSGGGR